MEKLKIVIKKYWKIYLAALVISAVCDLIGTVKLNIGVGTLISCLHLSMFISVQLVS